MDVTFIVPGPPKPWQRAAVSRYGAHYTELETKAFQFSVKLMAANAVAKLAAWPLDARYRVTIAAYFADKRSRDLDNVAKSVCDAMNKTAYADDRQIDLLVVGRHIDKANPRTVVSVEVIT